MNRKEFLKIGASASLGGLGSVRAQSEVAATDRPPNVLVLMSDQHRPDLLTCGGNDEVPTPGIDRIASRGVRFTRAYCPYPVCAPSRMSFLTGLHAHHHGITINTRMLDWRRRTIAHAFRDHGHLTGLIGKMHFLDGNNHGFDFRLGFNDWLMYLGPKARHFANEIASYPGYAKTVMDTGSGFPDVAGLWKGVSPWVGNVTPKLGITSDLSSEDQFDAFVARESSRFIRRYRDQPFFLVAGFLKPHAPFFAPKEYAEMYKPERMQLPPVGDIAKYPEHVRKAITQYQGMGEERLRTIRAGYLANLRFVDTCIGEVYKTLEDEKLIDNTIVIYTSDHGEMGGDHGLFQKFVFFEPSVSVPLIVSYPKTIPAGKVSNALVEFIGLYPTLAEMGGLKKPEGLDAASFARYAKDPDARGPDAAFAEYALSWAPRYMIRTDRYKYNYNEDDTAELYDLEADPRENLNRAGETSMRQTQQRLHDQLFALYNPERNPFRRQREAR
ncbi:MAG: sulfatase-like hydrolase/transferase [Bryobacteraceae bacterium]